MVGLFVLTVQAMSHDEEEDYRSEMIYSSYQNFVGGGGYIVDNVDADSPAVEQNNRVRRSPIDGKTRPRRNNNNRNRKDKKKKDRFTTAQTTASPDYDYDTETDSSFDVSANSTCVICEQRKEHQRLMIERIKNDILVKLEMTEVANFTMPPYNITEAFLTTNFTNNEPPEPVGEVTTIFTYADKCKFVCLNCM
jgi:hypothetical protein